MADALRQCGRGFCREQFAGGLERRSGRVLAVGGLVIPGFLQLQCGQGQPDFGDVFGGSRQRALLDGAPGAYRDVVLLNAAAALIVGDRAGDLREGAELAAAVIDDGRAATALARLVEATNTPIAETSE